MLEHVAKHRAPLDDCESKLTVAQHVYRGIAGGLLPAEFWTPNEYNVRGGIEGALQKLSRLGEKTNIGGGGALLE